MTDKPNQTSPDEQPVYPFTMDAGANPSRKYLAATYYLALFSLAAAAFSIALGLLIILRAGSMRSLPYLVKWDAAERRFESVMHGDGQPETVKEGQFLEEYFVREYIRRMFSISTAPAENEGNWCSCEKPAEHGLFMGDVNCWICNFSASNVYSNFAGGAKPIFELAARRGEARNTNILEVRLISHRFDPAPSGFAALLPGRKPVRAAYSEYRADFSAGGEYFTAYIAVSSPLENPKSMYRVDSASFSFTPKARRRK